MEIKSKLEEVLNGPVEDASNERIYEALMEIVQERTKMIPLITGDRRLYYVSAEFLLGKMLSNTLINLGLFDEVRTVLKDAGRELSEIEELEPEPSLGNGGLGRLAACYLDSAATLGLPADGVGLLYHFGLFKQKFENFKQREYPDEWLSSQRWLRKTDTEFTVPMPFGDVTAVMYEMDVPGYENGKNRLRLFDLKTSDETLVRDGIDFDKRALGKNLTLFLYPDDSDRDGRLLRVYQEYFMVSSAAQLILKELKDAGHPVSDLPKYTVIQINDTHPSMIIPELIRLMVGEGISFSEAVDAVRNTCAYTNHTILAEALEKWPLDYLNEAVPGLVPVIEKLDALAKETFGEGDLSIIDSENMVRMASMDIHYGFSVNGVAALHTEILRTSELRAFYEYYPEKFSNKTNGITFRRWLIHCNPELSDFITSIIGNGWKRNANELKKLMDFSNDEEVLSELLRIKDGNKRELCAYVKDKCGIDIIPDSVFDVQIKRLHEYKRQQMNALYVIWKYLEIKSGKIPSRPVTVFFGAKAAPAYTIAKDIIHLILCLCELVNSDPEVSPYLKVVMVENYNVSWAEKLIPAADISEQISLASKEASGTGNMKFMLNGAVTLGTLDGANVEISELVGGENIALFGKRSEDVIRLYAEEAYTPRDFYPDDPVLEKLLDFIISPKMMRLGDPESLGRLYRDMTRKDWFMALLDTRAYIERKEKLLCEFDDRLSWSKKMLANIANAGFFSSDRAVKQYNEDIWHLVPRIFHS